MAAPGVLFAVDALCIERLRAMKTAERPAYISQDLEELYFEEYPERTCELEGSWEAMHRAFTGGDFTFDGFDSEKCPLGMAILGGELLYFDGEKFDDYIISAKTPEQVKAVSSAISALTEADFKKMYKKIGSDYEDKSAEDYEYTLEFLQDSVPFWRFAAEHGLYVLFTAEI